VDCARIWGRGRLLCQDCLKFARMRVARDFRNVGPQGQADREFGGRFIVAVVLQRTLAYVASRDSDNCIFACVIGWNAPEQLDADDTFFR
jgi:hypothetical protein